ncbi:hypothetical protein PanWU01x14_253180 [Parasponia andersonii]|uniref:P-loop containing nucleoside triphosphate hydrolase n=1 Tax=Parasponia andersonii TaxID=3476 RepID=A0A2P5BBM0_PARAD|nr:hypothetical protein PanWU01x14_253180 [Parasponia andersonii]
MNDPYRIIMTKADLVPLFRWIPLTDRRRLYLTNLPYIEITIKGRPCHQQEIMLSLRTSMFTI